MSETFTPRLPQLPRRAAIVGAGPIGCVLAVVLGKTVPVTLVVRSQQHFEQIEARGIELRGEITGHSRPQIVRSVEGLDEVAHIDLLCIATKTTAIDAICDQLVPYRDRLPCICAIQNGISPGEDIVRKLNWTAVLRMVPMLGARFREAPAPVGPFQVEVPVMPAPSTVGGGRPEAYDSALRLAQMLVAGGLPTRATQNIEVAVWQKSLLNAATNPVSALLRSSMALLHHQPAEALVRKLLEEGHAVAKARNVPLPENFVDAALKRILAAGDHTPSMVQDLVGGRPTEIAQLNRRIVDYGTRAGVPTPTHRAITQLVETLDLEAMGS